MSYRHSCTPGRRRYLGYLGLLFQAAVLVIPRLASCAEINWRTTNFNYIAQNKPLKEFIRDFAADQGLSVIIAADVDGTVNGKFNLTPQSMLDLLAMSYGVTWYYDGSVLYVSPAGDISSEVVQLGSTNAGQLQEALNRLGIFDRRYPIYYDRTHATARVAGPKRYVELIKQTVQALNLSAEQQPAGVADARAEIRVFPLRYAWAADFTYTADGQDHTLPGVVSVLRDLYAIPSPGLSGTNGLSPRQAKLQRLQGMGYFRDSQVPGAQADRLAPVAPRPDAATGSDNGVSQPIVLASNGLPQFQADGRMNAVIVRDVPQRMASYNALIRSLDVKPGLVEIEARILEISTDSIDSLGIDWRAASGSANLQISQAVPGAANATSLGASTALPGGIPTISTPGLTSPLVLPLSQLPQGGVLTTVLGDSGRFLMARVNALAEDGKANVLSSPRVMTLDNVEAVLENLNTFFVPVAGNLDVGLYNVSAGTSLRVTPLIVTEGGRTQIKLAIRIEDGGITQQSVGNLPVIQRTTITTQAFINEGESLLIGGYKSDVRNDTETGVPGLKSLPVVGALFRHRQKETSHVEHLFMLTPRVIDRS
jgi:type III secretion protein C